MSSFQAAGNTEKLHLLVWLRPSLPPSPVTGSPSVCPWASAVILPSFLSLPGVLCFFASSLHQLPSLPPTYPPFLSVPFTLFSFNTPPYCMSTPPPTPPNFIVLPLLDSILFLPLPLPPSPPVLLHVIMHHPIPYHFVTFCFLLGIHNPLHISVCRPFLLCVWCFISSTWNNYLSFIALPVLLSHTCWCSVSAARFLIFHTHFSK